MRTKMTRILDYHKEKGNQEKGYRRDFESQGTQGKEYFERNGR